MIRDDLPNFNKKNKISRKKEKKPPSNNYDTQVIVTYDDFNNTTIPSIKERLNNISCSYCGSDRKFTSTNPGNDEKISFVTCCNFDNCGKWVHKTGGVCNTRGIPLTPHIGPKWNGNLKPLYCCGDCKLGATEYQIEQYQHSIIESYTFLNHYDGFNDQDIQMIKDSGIISIFKNFDGRHRNVIHSNEFYGGSEYIDNLVTCSCYDDYDETYKFYKDPLHEEYSWRRRTKTSFHWSDENHDSFYKILDYLVGSAGKNITGSRLYCFCNFISKIITCGRDFDSYKIIMDDNGRVEEYNEYYLNPKSHEYRWITKYHKLHPSIYRVILSNLQYVDAIHISSPVILVNLDNMINVIRFGPFFSSDSRRKKNMKLIGSIRDMAWCDFLNRRRLMVFVYCFSKILNIYVPQLIAERVMEVISVEHRLSKHKKLF